MYQLILDRILKNAIKEGGLIISYNQNTKNYGDIHSRCVGKIVVNSDRFFSRAIKYGEIGLCESYIEGEWSSTNICDVMLVFFLNVRNFFLTFATPFENPFLLLSALEQKIFPSYKPLSCSIEDSKKGMSISYDIGNSFYEKGLDKTRTYSCAIFKDENSSLDEAQQHKLDIIIKKLNLKPEHKVLDIGSGWGGLLNEIYQRYRCEVTGIALAKEQIDYCRENYKFGKFEYLDYRDLSDSEHYDRIVSIGMIEHVGYENLLTYMNKIATALKPNGRALIHSMIKGPLFDRKVKPGITLPNSNGKYSMVVGYLPYDYDMTDAILNTKQLRVIHQEKFGVHYGKTFRLWKDNLLKNSEYIKQNYSERLLSQYDYLCAMMSSAFTTGFMDVVQIVVEKSPVTHSSSVYDPRA